MQYAKDADRRSANCVCRYVRRSADYNLARPGNSAKPATCWKIDQATDCNDEAFVNQNGGGRVLCLDKRENCIAIR